MIKRFTHFFAYLLLVLMPLQALAIANMATCNSLMQTTQVDKQFNQKVQTMPCHKHVAEKSKLIEKSNNHHKSSNKYSCKTTCATVCASLCAMTAMPVSIQSTFTPNHIQLFNFNSQLYTSITQSNLQRPPIFLA